MRRVLVISSHLLVALLASCGTVIWADSRPIALPPLLQGIPLSLRMTEGVSPEFTQRLNKRFPPGSPETSLIRELWLSGFRPDTDLGASQRGASVTFLGDHSYICRRDAYVSWSADSGRLTSISGTFVQTCS